MPLPTFMPFGKHRGLPLQEIPSDYLQWIIRECDNAKQWLKDAVAAELQARAGDLRRESGQHASKGDVSGVVKKWYRNLCLKYHPDRGGSHEAMVAIQEAYERLKDVLDLDD